MSRRNQAESRSPGDAPADARALTDAAPAGGVSGMDPMLEAKLWRNPCWLAFRVNYLALRYNGPLYDWVRRKYGLSRPEYVVIYSLALSGGGRARDITRTSGFPKNTLSRAITRLESLGLILRSRAAGQGRNQPLNLSETGRALFDESLPIFVEHERAMLSGLTEEERATLSRLMAKVVLSADDWPNEITVDAPSTGQSGETR
jgi:DNA-binding MarR family transcriptional regulator